MVFGTPTISWERRHWPMQGPQALASTVAPIASRVVIWPSRSIVARTCSEPGVTMKGTAARTPCARACSTTSAERLMSSYEELVQLPIRAVEMASTNWLRSSWTSAARREIGRARSGECGPTMWGSSFDRSITTVRSK